MADFDIDLEDFNEEGGFGDLRTSGLHDVTLKHISVNKKPNGVIEWSVTVNSGGQYDDTFYGVAAKFKSGKFSPNMNKVIKPMLKLAGITNPSWEGKLVDTKDGKKEITVYAGIDNLPIKLAIRQEWDSYRSEYQPKIFRVFNIDGRTSTEVAAGEIKAVQITKINFSDITSDRGGKAPTGGGTTTQATPEVDMDDEFDID